MHVLPRRARRSLAPAGIGGGASFATCTFAMDATCVFATCVFATCAFATCAFATCAEARGVGRG
ncbi:hypothetical protein [Burkholderia pseudomallei]|uniref:hypothetical protein n=1 Tax=Burkholderia pseudomallei TaxID=28450 RepID=UPI00059DBD9D|nr:hypothetical protein [Burkholderia pseudomallei]APZ20136.1 hypothetical protein BGI47_16800 [Burkholderia pseudomallei]APZ26330.1 hypothetical protein BGI46_16800 [Burkholderia pseudomallei]OMZ36660.1 hypothetical protein AQ862_04885 [Burkholderia pseudomallei]